MSKLNLDISTFKKVAGDNQSTTMKHEDGHEIRIWHKGVDRKVAEQLAKLPMHRADGTPEGGESDPVGAAQNVLQGPDASAPSSTPAPAQVDGLAGDSTGLITQSNDPYGYAKELSDTQAGVSGQMTGENALAGAQSGLSKKQAEIQGQGIDQQKQTLSSLQDNLTGNATEYQQFRNDLATQQIDPQHYWHNRSDLGKVSTAIGLILGGIGGGLTHQENPAMKFLQSHIQQDIAAQKMDLGRKESLLTANLQHQGNIISAGKMTQAMQNSILEQEVNRQANLSADPIVHARAQMFNSQLQQQSAQAIQQAAMNKTLYSGQNANRVQSAELDPAMDRRVDVGNAVFHAPDKETADKVRPQLQALDELEQATNQVDNFNNKQGTTYLPKTQASGQADGVNSTMNAALSRVEGAGGQISRLLDKFRDAAPNAGAFFQNNQKGKSQAIRSLIAQQRASLIKDNLHGGQALPKRK